MARITSIPMFWLTRKLRSIKLELKASSMTKFANFCKQVGKNTNILQLVESKLIADPLSIRLNDWYFRLLKQREKLLLLTNVIGAILLVRDG